MKRTPLARKTPLKACSANRAGVALRTAGMKPSVRRLKQGRSTGKPTADQVRRFLHIRLIGCLACLKNGQRPPVPEVHHLAVTGRHGHKRRGHDFTIGLCGWHHQGVPPMGMNERSALANCGPSYKLHARAFREHYGQDDSLLELQNQLIALREVPHG